MPAAVLLSEQPFLEFSSYKFNPSSVSKLLNTRQVASCNGKGSGASEERGERGKYIRIALVAHSLQPPAPPPPALRPPSACHPPYLKLDTQASRTRLVLAHDVHSLPELCLLLNLRLTLGPSPPWQLSPVFLILLPPCSKLLIRPDRL